MLRRASRLLSFLAASWALLCFGCRQQPRQADAVTFLIESNPPDLDPRYATDGQSARIGGLIFDALLERDDQMNLHGDLAESWTNPDPLTYVFHLRHDVKFHDGRPLTSADVKSTIEFMLNPANHSPKQGAFRLVTSIEAPDPVTVIFHLKEPYASFLWNLERSAIGIVPAGAPADFARHPIGTGPFRFVNQAQDDYVALERNASYFRGVPKIQTVIFRVVPDAIVRALELRKGSADLEMSSLSPDLIPILARQSDLEVSRRTGTNLAYLGFNFADPILSRREVRQALAYGTDRQSLIKYLLHGQGELASGLLPPSNWAYSPDVPVYPYDPAQAEKLLDTAGLPRTSDGKRPRFHLTLKVSTEEPARLLAAALQEQWKKIGVELEIRPLELATLFSDLSKGNFQITSLRWVGANNDPDIFELVFSSKRFPPNGFNRGHYSNPQMDLLTTQIRTEMNREKRKELCSLAQKLVADDLPYLPLCFVDVVSVHRRALGDLSLSPTGDYAFLAKP